MQEKGRVALANLSDCERTDLIKYRPDEEIVRTLNYLFTEPVIDRITDLTRDLKPFLISQGFEVLQYPYSSTSAIVVEHQSLSRLILKFSRDPQYANEGKFKERLQIIKKRSLALRAINAERLNTFLTEHSFKHVRVPKKFFCCVANRFPVLLAEKLSLTTRRTLVDLGPEEITEILAVVEFSRGTLDLWPRNIIILDSKIQFIDLERQEEPLLWQAIILDSVKEFSERVNPACKALVEDWFERVAPQREFLKERLTLDRLPAKVLKLAVVTEDAEKVRQLLNDNTFDAIRLDKLLFKAIESGNADVVEMLLENGANPYVPNRRGFTSEELARSQGNPKIISLLKRVQRR